MRQKKPSQPRFSRTRHWLEKTDLWLAGGWAIQKGWNGLNMSFKKMKPPTKYNQISSCNLNLPIFGVCPESHVGLGQQLLRFEEFHHTLSCVRPHPTGFFSPIGEPWRMPFMWNKACFDHGTYQILGSPSIQTAALNCMVSCNHCSWRNSSGWSICWWCPSSFF